MSTNPSEFPRGYRYAAMAAGLKKSGKPDLALIFSETPARAAGVFTTNKVIAAPVTLTSERFRGGACQAILVNSGNANACTGRQGLADAEQCGQLLARSLSTDEGLVAVSSTGVIGVPLPMEKLAAAIPTLSDKLAVDQVDAVAAAMMTTDSFPKVSARTVPLEGGGCRILGLAKGAGMIHPNMATMLCFVLTDARIEAAVLDTLLRRAVNGSFNRITVDRDTSTNDMVLLLANGAAETPELRIGTPEIEAFQAALDAILLDLAKMIVRDGEGATKLVRIQVDGASSDAEALQVAESIATSALVKTALFGEDANWGRIIAAAGYSGAAVDPERVRILFDDVPMVDAGIGLGAEQEELATVVMQRPEFTVTVDLGLGDGAAYYYTSDLTYDYVRINADYRS